MYGVKYGKRMFLLPNLIFFPLVISALVGGMVYVIQKGGVITCTFAFLSLPLTVLTMRIYIWVDLIKHWTNLVTSENEMDAEGTCYSESPPKYDDLEHCIEDPPCYEEAIKCINE